MPDYSLLLIQILLILLLTRSFGLLAAKLGLAMVVGEMLAGIALGPSLFGSLAPDWQAALFPPQNGALLGLVAKVGVCLYMLLAGLDMDFSALRRERRAVLSLTLSSSLMPFILGALLAWPLFQAGGYFGANADALSAPIFLGICFAITALPVLARLLDEFRIRHSRLGRWALSASAGSDLLAWLVLALLLSRGELMGLLVPGLLLLGVALGHSPLRRHLEKLKVLSPWLLPFYFVHVGLHTDFGNLLGGGHWLVGLSLLLAALGSKLAAGVITGRALGLDSRDSWRLGLMLNTRGLMELILLEQGRAMGLIGPELHSVLVLMTIVTTVMAAPLLRLLQGAPATAALPESR